MLFEISPNHFHPLFLPSFVLLLSVHHFNVPEIMFFHLLITDTLCHLLQGQSSLFRKSLLSPLHVTFPVEKITLLCIIWFVCIRMAPLACLLFSFQLLLLTRQELSIRASSFSYLILDHLVFFIPPIVALI
jgi:hypothetical protein